MLRNKLVLIGVFVLLLVGIGAGLLLQPALLVQYHINKAEHFQEIGDLAKAAVHLQDVVDIKKDDIDPDIVCKLARIESDPTKAAASHTFCANLLYSLHGHFTNDARTSALRALELHASPMSYRVAIKAVLNSGLGHEAKRIVTEFITMYPSDPYANYAAGVAAWVN